MTTADPARPLNSEYKPMPSQPHFVPVTPSATHVIAGGSERLFHSDQRVLIERWQIPAHELKTTQPADILNITVTANIRNLWLTAVGNELHLYLEQVLYQITPSSPTQQIRLSTQDGDDNIYVDDTLTHRIRINSGGGADYLAVGGVDSRIITGPGDDTVKITSGNCYLDTGSGDDSVRITGFGSTRVYAGEGDDSIRAGNGLTFIDGGPNDDIIVGGSGHNILSGGEHNDSIQAGSGSNAIYTGTGNDRVTQLKPTDKAYANERSTLHALDGQERWDWLRDRLGNYDPAQLETIMEVIQAIGLDTLDATRAPDSYAGTTGLIIEGRPEYIARVEADLALIRNSPNGRLLLQALDRAAASGRQAVTIKYSEMENAQFLPSYQRITWHGPRGPITSRPDPLAPTLRDNQAGPPAYGGTVNYNPQFSSRGLIPLISLYHELCHAYNAVTGTEVLGETEETLGSQKAMTKNAERQAVGLPIDMEPFDFDFDPSTPPTRTNPQAFTENSLLKELGLPERRTYLSEKKDS